MDEDEEFKERQMRVRYRLAFPADTDAVYWSKPYMEIEWDMAIADVVKEADGMDPRG